MRNKIVKLAKRMGKITVAEILPILSTSSDIIKPIIDSLVKEEILVAREDGCYFYHEKESKVKLPLFFEFRTEQELDIIIRAFCLGIPSTYTSQLIKLSDATICKYNRYFRNLIFNMQLKNLKVSYNIKAQKPRLRTFFNKSIYLYIYNNEVYVSEHILYNNQLENNLTRDEVLEIKRIYSKLTRKITHNSMINIIGTSVAEELWRIYNPKFENKLEFIYSHIK